jgi:hypothetical protein
MSNPNPNPNNNSMNQSTQSPQIPQILGGSKPTIFTPLMNSVGYINHHIMYLNNSKFFAGVIMILLNIGSKFITIQFSKSTEEYMKWTVSKQLLVFSMAWMGTRDIYAALGLTAVFTILSEYLFNEESSLCIVPEKYRVLEKLIDTDDDNVVSELELSAAVAVLEKAKREKRRKNQREAFKDFDFQKYNYDK